MQEQSDNGQQGAPLYRVTQITDQLSFDPASGGGRVKRVNFQLADGTVSYVDVPLSEFNAANVQRLVEDHVEQLLAVKGIQAPTLPPSGY